MRVVITSGYFNPIHPGHIDYLDRARDLGDRHIVIVNNDLQAELKRGRPSFMCEADRLCIVRAIKYVDEAVLSIDKDATVCKTLEEIASRSDLVQYIFAKGGDRFANEIPEATICRQYNIQMIDGLGLKTHHSSQMIGLTHGRHEEFIGREEG